MTKEQKQREEFWFRPRMTKEKTQKLHDLIYAREVLDEKQRKELGRKK